MDFEALAEQILNEEALEKKRAWRKNPKFLAIQGVSKEDILNGSSYIEKLKYPPWDKRNDSPGSAANNNASSTIGYGKYASKSYQWVKDNDERYFSWMLDNVPKFAAAVKKLGL
jgi:hypothetical protein